MNIEDRFDRPFIAVATDMVTGHEVWLRQGNLVDCLRASFSLPGIFPPVMLDHRWLIDGALVNPVPVSVCLALDAQMTIAVNLNADILGVARRPGSTIPTVAGFDLLDQHHESASKARRIPLARRLFRRQPDSPSLFGVMFASLNILQDRIGKPAAGGRPARRARRTAHRPYRTGRVRPRGGDHRRGRRGCGTQAVATCATRWACWVVPVRSEHG